ncbi:hypothetical protein [Halomonas sp. M20]|uniref:hypothetical protein n=1 Tax=Halomonas sp. M20 TaxID=2763264 RepID=UPI001D0B018A|nr:hypothetical protein [Halomonas sp. M20]
MKLLMYLGGVVVFLGVVLAFVDSGAEAVIPLTPEQERYCEAVNEWRKQELFDAPKGARTGHPDHRNLYDQWCE